MTCGRWNYKQVGVSLPWIDDKYSRQVQFHVVDVIEKGLESLYPF